MGYAGGVKGIMHQKLGLEGQQKDKQAFIKEVCLVNQPFVKDPKVTIQEYLNTILSKMGENIFIGRFIRYKVGEAA